MPKNSKNSFQAFNDFFAKAPSKNQKSWSLLNDFYDLLLTYMDDNEISQADLAKKLNCSRSAVSQMFSKKPNISLKKVVDIADAIGIEIKFVSEQVPSRIPKKLLNKTMDMARRSLVMELDPAWTTLMPDVAVYNKDNNNKEGIKPNINVIYNNAPNSALIN